jgi:DNA polymerase/3'-5' exonuclease PolX
MVKFNKSLIIKYLSIIKEYEVFKNDRFKIKAYDNVINNLHIYPKDITDLETLQKNNFGIGKGIFEKIKELYETGKISYINENIKKDKLYKFKQELIKIYGIGPANINKIIDKGIKTIPQLKKNIDILNAKQQIGFKYYKDLKRKIPLTEFKKHITIINKDLSAFTHDFVGSYRRGKKSMGDIDVIIMKHPSFDLKTYIQSLKSINYVIETLALGSNKFMGIVKLPNEKVRRLDILIAPPNEYYFSLLYFTGSQLFNIGMRHYVKQIFNLSLSEHGFNKKITSIKSEEDIFKYLKLKYVKPKNRKLFIL